MIKGSSLCSLVPAKSIYLSKKKKKGKELVTKSHLSIQSFQASVPHNPTAMYD